MIVNIDSLPARGEGEDSESEYVPSRVAESDKQKHFIGLNDVLTSDEKTYYQSEVQSRPILNLMQKDSKLTDLTENFLTELASNGKCVKEMEMIDRCLQGQKNGQESRFLLF